MATCVVDASVVIAALFLETGWEKAAELLPVAAISAANVGEIASRLSRDGLDLASITAVLDALPLTIIALSGETAIAAGAMEPVTKAFGLSLGDRICISLSRQLALPAYTADRQWMFLAETLHADIRLIR